MERKWPRRNLVDAVAVICTLNAGAVQKYLTIKVHWHVCQTNPKKKKQQEGSYSITRPWCLTPAAAAVDSH